MTYARSLERWSVRVLAGWQARRPNCPAMVDRPQYATGLSNARTEMNRISAVGGPAKAGIRSRGSTSRFRSETTGEAGHRSFRSHPELSMGGTGVAAGFLPHRRRMHGDHPSPQI